MNSNNKTAVEMAILFEITLLYTAIVSITSSQWKDLSLSILAIVCLLVPFLVTRISNRTNIVLPSSFQLVSLLFIFMAQYFGELKRFYLIFWWWDLLLHAIFGSFAVAVALYLIKGTIKKEQDISDQRFTLFIIIFAFSFSICLGTLWEMFEFVGDYVFRAGMVKGGLVDTSTDLLGNILAAFITAGTCYYLILRKKFSP